MKELNFKARNFNHIAAYYRYLAKIDETTFGSHNMTDKAGWYQLASNGKKI